MVITWWVTPGGRNALAGSPGKVEPASLVPLTLLERRRLFQAQEALGVPRGHMLALAGWQTACFTRQRLGGEVMNVPLLLLAGAGRNGAVGLLAGQHLSAWGAEVQVVLSVSLERLHSEARGALMPLLAAGIPVMPLEMGWELPAADLLLEALFGGGCHGAPRGDAAELIRLANGHPADVVSVDTPAGLLCDGGEERLLVIRAAATLALGWPLSGLALASGPAAVGDLYLADVGLLPEAFAQAGMAVPPPGVWPFGGESVYPLVIASE